MMEPERQVVELAPQGAPPPIGAIRRAVCGVTALALLSAGLYLLTAPNFSGLIFVMGATMLAGSVVLAGAALFPALTFQKLDRSRWR